MTLLNTRPSDRRGMRPGTDTPSIDIAWYNPESNLWVAAADGEHAGMIEFVDGRFSVRNGTGEVVAEAVSIPDAQSALAHHLATPVAAPERTFLQRMPRPISQRGPLAA